MSIPHAVLGTVACLLCLWGYITNDLSAIGSGALVTGLMLGIIISYDEKEIKTQSEYIADLRRKAK